MKVIYVRDGIGVELPEGAHVVSTVNKLIKPHIMLDGVEYKHCSNCNSWRCLDKYYKSSSTNDKLQNFCKTCQDYLRVSRRIIIPKFEW